MERAPPTPFSDDDDQRSIWGNKGNGTEAQYGQNSKGEDSPIHYSRRYTNSSSSAQFAKQVLIKIIFLFHEIIMNELMSLQPSRKPAWIQTSDTLRVPSPREGIL
jgi:hypothetical protein